MGKYGVSIRNEYSINFRLEPMLPMELVELLDHMASYGVHGSELLLYYREILLPLDLWL